jgi:hypothetical protein
MRKSRSVPLPPRRWFHRMVSLHQRTGTAHCGTASRALYKRSMSPQASRHRPYELPKGMTEARSIQSNLQRAPSRVWGANGGGAQAVNTPVTRASKHSRFMEKPPISWVAVSVLSVWTRGSCVRQKHGADGAASRTQGLGLAVLAQHEGCSIVGAVGPPGERRPGHAGPRPGQWCVSPCAAPPVHK